MRHEFSNGISQSVLPEQDHPIQTTFFNRAHKPFRKCVQIRRSRWQLDRFDAGIGDYAEKLIRIQRVTIMNQISFAVEEPVDRIREV